MTNNTGFYRVSKITYSSNTSKKTRWQYRAKNSLLNVNLTSNNLLKLKVKVLEANLDWGIIDLKKAKQTCKKARYNIKDLEGQYGLKVKGE